MKNPLLLFFCFVASLSCSAQKIYGTCGDSLAWELNVDTLTISGTGPMCNYSPYPHFIYSPWYQYRTQIETIVVQEGVTSIGRSAFYNFPKVKSVILPNSVRIIEENAFSLCTSLEHMVLPSNLKIIGNDAFRGSKITTPKSIIKHSGKSKNRNKKRQK